MLPVRIYCFLYGALFLFLLVPLELKAAAALEVVARLLCSVAWVATGAGLARASRAGACDPAASGSDGAALRGRSGSFRTRRFAFALRRASLRFGIEGCDQRLPGQAGMAAGGNHAALVPAFAEIFGMFLQSNCAQQRSCTPWTPFLLRHLHGVYET